MDRLPFLKNLNGLRFLAASYVIGFHFFSFPGFDLLNRFLKRGHIAVPFFFLLSGFILYYNYFQHEFNYKKYWKSRYIRLAPIYYMAMFAALPMLYIQQKGNDYSTLKNIFYFFSNLTLTQALFINHDIISFWNMHSWSLSVEMFLYICSPFIIIKIRKLSNIQTFFYLFIMLLTNTLIFNFAQYPTIKALLKNHFAPIYLFTFITGCLLARIYLTKTAIIKKVSCPLFIVSTSLLMSSFLMSFSKDFYTNFNPFYQIIFSLLILSSCHEHIFNKWLGIPYLLILGEASYAMYIFQAPVKLFVQQFLYKVIGYEMNTGFFYCLIVFLAITLISVIVSRYIDPIVRKKLRKKLIS